MRFSSAASALALLILPSVAFAQKGGGGKVTGNPNAPKSSTQFSLRRGDAGGADAQIARTRARSGDCVGALTAFDAAIRNTIDPTLRRDRGLCHEKLNHPYPAIDDYRAYLVARPDAPDNEQIRERLRNLEAQVGQGGEGGKEGKGAAEEEPTKPEGGEVAGGKYVASGSMSIGSSGAKASAKSSQVGPESGDASHSYDYYAAQEKKEDEADSSPLRRGEGIILGAFLHVPRYFVGQGTSKDMGYGVGGTLRWATGPTLSLISELGYAAIGTQGANTSQGGLLLFGGVELRLPVTRYASDQVLLRGGLGYEHYKVSGTQLSNNVMLGRFGLGFRHVFGPSLAFDILFDGGPAYVMPQESENRVVGMVSASAALLVAF